MSHLIKTIAATAALFGLSQTAIAQEAQSGWIEYDFAISEKGAWIDADDPAGKFRVDGIYSKAAGGGSTMFYCLDGELTMFVAAEDFDFSTDMRQSNRRQDVMVAMTSNGEQINRSKWRYFPSVKLAQPEKFSDVAKLYNGTVKQEEMSLDSSRFGPTTLALPPVDDTFKEFSAACGL